MIILYFTSLIATITLGCILLILKIKGIFVQKYNIMDLVYILYFVFFILPLIMDILIGIPEYKKYPAFYDASHNYVVMTVYNIFIILIPLYWMILSKGKFMNISINLRNTKYSNLFIMFSSVGMIVPFLLVWFSPDISIYYTYGPISLKNNVSQQIRDYHTLLSAFTKFSVIFACIIIYFSKKSLVTLTICSPFIFTSLWIDGKRTIVILFLILLLIILLVKKVFSGALYFLTALTLIILFFCYSMVYQNQIRSFGDESFQFKYENFRVDYGRDDALKMAIMYEFEKDISILEYRGQSFLFYLTAYIPREFWEGKPYPYAQYFTSALFYNLPKLWGWGMTTSIFDEAIANFGLLGFILGPHFVYYLARKGESFNNPLFKLYTVIVIAFLMTVHLIAFAPIFILWIVLLLINNGKLRLNSLK